MGFFSWIILGLIAGWLAKFFMSLSGIGVLKTILLGIVGAIIGGYISTFLGWGDVHGINLPSIIIAVFGAIVTLFVYRLIRQHI